VRAAGLAIGVFAGALAACAPGGGAGAPAPELRLDEDPESPTHGSVVLGPLAGLEEQRPEARATLEERLETASLEEGAPFVVWTGTVAPAADGCVHPQGQATVLGALRVRGDRLSFAPRLGFVPGLAYTACADLVALARLLPQAASVPRAASILRLPFTPSGPAAEAPRVTAVWPAGEEIPENLLRIYLEFSEPMMERGVAGRVHLLDAAGEPVPEAFVEIPDGLWDARSTRLTLFLHPGRIKRGVGPHRALGPPLVAGSTVELRVDGELASRRGLALGSPFQRTYRVGAADRASPDPGRWRVEPPGAAGAPVTVRFDEPLDRALLLRFVAVLPAGDGRPVSGEGNASEDGRAWSFTPDGGWQAGRYRVAVRRAIEDLAGNTVDRLFDVETPADPAGAASTEVAFPGAGGDVELPFGTRW
jgi:hypothetical protein